jgi:hypothetical protein
MEAMDKRGVRIDVGDTIAIAHFDWRVDVPELIIDTVVGFRDNPIVPFVLIENPRLAALTTQYATERASEVVVIEKAVS